MAIRESNRMVNQKDMNRFEALFHTHLSRIKAGTRIAAVVVAATNRGRDTIVTTQVMTGVNGTIATLEHGGIEVKLSQKGEDRRGALQGGHVLFCSC